MKKQLIHIHGGEWFDSYDAYLEYLSAQEIRDPAESPFVKWRDRYEEFLDNDWVIIRPQMPNPQNAKYIEWKLWFEKYLTYLEDEVTIVGHSLGATFLAQYLSQETFPKKIHSLHLVAPAFDGAGGFGLDTNVSCIARQVSKIYLYHSKDDSLVPYEDSVRIKQLLPEADFVTFNDKGHFLIPEFPELIERIIEI